VSEEGPGTESRRTSGARGAAAGPWLLGVGGTAAVTALATLIAVRDDARGGLSLGILNPIVATADYVGRWLLEDPLPSITRVGVFCASLAIIVATLLWWRRRDAESTVLASVLCGVGLALIGQLLILHEGIVTGSVFYAGAALVVFCAHRRGWSGGGGLAALDDTGPPTWAEAATSLAFGTVAVFFRYYALNRTLHLFEGELSPFMAGATSLQGMLLANIGWQGPWAPMGILFYLPIWAMSAVAGSTVLAVRLGSAVIGILTFVVVYVVVRYAINRTAALWSAALLAVDTLQIGWGRSDMHPHGATAWPGVLLAGATIRAFTTGATSWYAAVMLLMGLSWHQYPSGQFVVIVPVVTFAVYAVFDHGFFKTSWRKALWFIAAGGGLWLFGYPLAHFLAVGRPVGPLEYVSRLGPRLLGGSDVAVYEWIPIPVLAAKLSQNGWDLVRGLFSEAPHVFFQTVIPWVKGLTQRPLAWFVVACAVIGLILCLVRIRERWSPPLLGLVAAGILPAILSDAAWLKRASLLYLALIIVATVPLSIVTSGLSRLVGRRMRWLGGGVLAVAFLLWSSVWVHLWFADRDRPFGVAAETMIFDAVEPHLKPDTLLVLSIWGDYIEGELLYLLSGAIHERQPLAYLIVTPHSPDWTDALASPLTILERIPDNPWYYSWLGLSGEIEEIVAHRDWSRVVYLIEHRPGVRSDFETLSERCPDLQFEGVFVGDDRETRDGATLKRYHVWIVRCDHHRYLRPPRFSVPALP
jgi:hypothetical protein